MATTKNPSQAPQAAVTLNDVAARAGVSAMTASRAFSGTGYVSEKSKRKVMEAAAAIGYFPDLSSRIMRGKRSNIFGLVVNDLTSSDIFGLVTQFVQVAREREKELLVYNVLGDQLLPHNGSSIDLLSGICDGLLVLQRIPDTLLRLLETNPTPVVLINYWRAQSSLPVVRADNFMCSRDAVRHLLDLGHQRIAFIGGTHFSGQSEERLHGYEAALGERGIAVLPAWKESGDFTRDAGRAAAHRLLALDPAPTAIFAANDGMALGVLDAARELALDVPAGLSVVGYDDIAEAAQAVPPLTTIAQPLKRIAEVAVDALQGRIGQAAHEYACQELPSKLLVRGSTAPPPLANPANPAEPVAASRRASARAARKT